MSDNFNFSAYVKSGRLHEGIFGTSLDPKILKALEPWSNGHIIVGTGGQFDQIMDSVWKASGHNRDSYKDFLEGSFLSAFIDSSQHPNIWDYADKLNINIVGDSNQPHQTSDVGVKPTGIHELVKEIVSRKLSEIQMGFEYNPKSVSGTGKKRGPKPIAFPYYELKAKFPEHFRLQSKDKDYTMLVSRDVIEAIGQLKDAGRNARSRQLTKLQDELRSLDTQTRRVLLKGTEGQKTFPVMGKEMYIVNWPVMGPNKTKEFLWLTPTQIAMEGAVDFQIDENLLD